MLYINNPYTDAWFNLAAEEYLLKNFSDDIFMLWQNEPSVIIGKHQNGETYFHEFIKEKQIEYKPAKSKVARLAQSLLKS